MYLREINLQAQLQRLVSDELCKRGESCLTTVAISDCGQGVKRAVLSDTPTMRAQMEMKIRLPGQVMAKERWDLVLLKPAPAIVQLTRAVNGSLDVIAPVNFESVDAVVELKAACSFDPAQRHLFRQDVLKLQTLLLHTGSDLEVHFVLVDKSIAFGPHVRDLTRAAVDSWEQGAPIVWRKRLGSAGVLDQPSPQLMLQEPGPELPGVHVWDLTAAGDVRHRFWAQDTWRAERIPERLAKLTMPAD